MKKLIIKKSLLLLFLFLTSAAQAEDIDVEFSYVLGHDQYRFHAWSHGDQIEGKSFLNQKILKSSKHLEAKNFENWVTKVQSWMTEKPKLERSVASTAPCRSTYWLSLKNSSGIRTVEGCRTSAQESMHFNRISREGDFLLYSGK